MLSKTLPTLATSLRLIVFAAMLSFLSSPAFAAVSNCGPEGTHSTGAIYRICMPEPGKWNGQLVVFAHGLVPFNEPIHIPEEQLVLSDGVSIPLLANAIGYAFAMTSYRKTGLAVQEGVEDLRDLVTLFSGLHGAPTRTYLVGPSEGGLIATLAVERFPETFHGGISACGYIGNFRHQLDYIGNFRALFDYFFPGVLPGDAATVPDELITNWSTYVPAIMRALGQNPGNARQLITTARVPVAPGTTPEALGTIVGGLLWDHMISTNDNRDVLGGKPFDNRTRNYVGSDNDTLLNQSIQRFDADPPALLEIAQRYQTTGMLTAPIVTLHTTGDHMIPYWHARIYRLKTLLTGSGTRHVNIPISRYGHCSYEWTEVLYAFIVLVDRVNAQTAGASGARMTVVEFP